MKKNLLLCLTLFVIGQLSAQSISFSLEVDQDTIRVGELLTVTYKLSGARGDFQSPDFEGLRLVGGPNYSSEIRIVQGQMDQTFTYTYIFQPIEAGDLYIPEATVTVDDEIYISPSSTVHVTANENWKPERAAPVVPKERKTKSDEKETRI